MRALHIFYISMVTVAIFFGIQKVCLSILLMVPVYYSFDEKTSVNLQKEIIQYCNSIISEKKNISLIIEKVKNEFPVLKSITAELSSESIYFTVKINKPQLIINGTIVYANRNFFNPTNFSPISLKNLFEMQYVLPTNLLDGNHQYSILLPLIPLLLNELYKNYEITIYNQQKIKLQDKERSQCTIICDKETIPGERLLKLCDIISKKHARKNVHLFTADVRFKDQIILYGTGEV